MALKRILLFAPLLLTGFLLQSYLWVPTYDKQARGNPDRLVTYIEGSIGDAVILNPILQADGTSSDIVRLVFEGLLDLDENLNLRGRLATDWTIREKTYLSVNPFSRLPDGVAATATGVAERIRKALDEGKLPDLVGVVKGIHVANTILQVVPISVPNNGERWETNLCYGRCKDTDSGTSRFYVEAGRSELFCSIETDYRESISDQLSV